VLEAAPDTGSNSGSGRSTPVTSQSMESLDQVSTPKPKMGLRKPGLVAPGSRAMKTPSATGAKVGFKVD